MQLTKVYDIKYNGDFSITVSFSYIERNMILLALVYCKEHNLQKSISEIKGDLLLYSDSFQNHNISFDSKNKKTLITILNKYNNTIFKKGIQNMSNAFNQLNTSHNSLNYKFYNPFLQSIELKTN